MNGEKNELLQAKAPAGGYLAPRVKVHEFRQFRILCESVDSDNYGGYTNPGQEGY